jgi:hypothetical protein
MTADGLKFEELDETLAVEVIAKTGWMGERSTYPALIVKRFVRFPCATNRKMEPNATGEEVAKLINYVWKTVEGSPDPARQTP